MKFADLQLVEPVLKALQVEGYETATPIQAQAIPHILAGSDLLGSAQTGTGKTAAFALPVIQRLADGMVQGVHKARCLVLCPTRELASQIAEGFRAYGKFVHLRHTVIFGGANQRPQVDALHRGVDIIIATPGRLLDLMEQGHVNLSHIQTLILDEADRMLDMGFINDIRRIVSELPAKRQTLLFSATMPKEILQLANSLLKNPVRVEIAPESPTADRVTQSVYFVDKGGKTDLLAHLFDALPMARTIVFTRTKHGADRVVRNLRSAGIKAEAIHGNKSQNNRQRALQQFKIGRIPMLVATDIAARGIDVDGITHVVNFDLTHEPETYVHRIGRTARAGTEGAAVSFCDMDELANLMSIQRLIKMEIPVVEEHPFHSTMVGDSAVRLKSHQRKPQGPSGGRPSSSPSRGGGRPQGKFANASNGGSSHGGGSHGHSQPHFPKPRVESAHPLKQSHTQPHAEARTHESAPRPHAPRQHSERPFQSSRPAHRNEGGFGGGNDRGGQSGPRQHAGKPSFRQGGGFGGKSTGPAASAPGRSPKKKYGKQRPSR